MVRCMKMMSEDMDMGIDINVGMDVDMDTAVMGFEPRFDHVHTFHGGECPTVCFKCLGNVTQQGLHVGRNLRADFN